MALAIGALVIGPSVTRAAVDSNFYIQLSMVRTIQDILHIQPRTHFLKTAQAMNSIFTTHMDLRPYTAIRPQIPLDTTLAAGKKNIGEESIPCR